MKKRMLQCLKCPHFIPRNNRAIIFKKVTPNEFLFYGHVKGTKKYSSAMKQ